MTKKEEDIMQVREIMTRDVITVRSELDLHEFAKVLIEKNISGAPVVDENGKFLGIVLEEGLIFQDKKVHLPTFVALSMGFLTLGADKFKQEMKRVAATTVADIMDKDAAAVSPDSSVEDIATMIVEKGVCYYPVVEGGQVIGVVTKKDIVRAIAKGKLW
jgi:predicted transcriptional regulator